MKVALAMIIKGVKEESLLLDKCLESVREHVDGIFLDINSPKGKKPHQSIIKVAKKYKADYKLTTWNNNFVEARNNNFGRVPKEYEWIIWLDSDDTVTNPHIIKETASVADSRVSGVYVKYDYAQDKYGNVTVAHFNARLVRNNGTFMWKSSIDDAEVSVHETLNPVRSIHSVKSLEFKIVHHSDEKRRDESLSRNIKLLEGMFDRNKKNPDPRILYYLATHYMDAGLYGSAKTLFEKYLDMSGWAEERSQAWVYLGDVYKQSGDKAKSRGCYMRAIAENPADPSPYVELGELEMSEQLWKKAIEWLSMAEVKKIDDTAVVLRPLEATYRTYKLLSECYANLGAKGLETASKWLKKALKLRPFDEDLLTAQNTLEIMIKERDLNEHALRLVSELKNNKEYEKIIPLIDSLPSRMVESPLVHSVRNYYDKPKIWGDKSIAIVCGSSALGNWGYWSLENGIGGSEEAVIQLSKELTSLGWSVTVYGVPGEKAGVVNGVSWKHYWEFNSKDTFDVLIGWRDPNLFDKAFKARKRYLWLHDVIDKEELTQERLDNLEGIIFVSKYHRNLFPDVPDNKAFASGNGIDPSQFSAIDNMPVRDQYKVVYMSAHERGQELLHRIWNDVVKEVPQAHLHCYYGWSGYDFVNKDNPERMIWKEKMLQQIKTLNNFTDHGKIGHKEIVQEIETAGIWAYPTAFPEVYCITGVKAQAGGAYPVISDYAVLPETVKYGDKLAIEELDPKTHTGKWSKELLLEYKNMLVKRLKNPPKDRKAMMSWARNNMSWESTAKEWNNEFNK